jgi:hypothetical protein
MQHLSCDRLMLAGVGEAKDENDEVQRSPLLHLMLKRQGA